MYLLWTNPPWDFTKRTHEYVTKTSLYKYLAWHNYIIILKKLTSTSEKRGNAEVHNKHGESIRKWCTVGENNWTISRCVLWLVNQFARVNDRHRTNTVNIIFEIHKLMKTFVLLITIGVCSLHFFNFSALIMNYENSLMNKTKKTRLRTTNCTQL